MPLPQRRNTSVLGLIGDTPMLEIRSFDTGKCRLFLKLECQNPGGSIKDRIGLSMIEAAEADGSLGPGGTVVEATSGNTGLSLALIAGQKGYRLVLVIPDKMSLDKIAHLRAMGAEVVMTRSDVPTGHPAYYRDVAARIAGEIPGAVWIDQFANPANPKAHEEWTGPEIWQQMDRDLDAVVCGVGSGGTVTGIGRFMKRVAPHVRMVLADPAGSVLADLVHGREPGKPGAWLVEGIGEDFVPPICELALVSEAITVSDRESFDTARALLKQEGVFAGSSTGTLVAAALRYCRQQTSAKRVVTFVCDGGHKYLSKMFNDYWMGDQGLLDRQRHGNLRDLIGRPAQDGVVVTVARDDTLMTAYGRMQMYDVSQLPVMADGRIIGIIDESDILLAVYRDPGRFASPVAVCMTEKLEVIAPDAPFQELLPIFRGDRVAIVVDGETFLGLITRTDVINHLRRSLR